MPTGQAHTIWFPELKRILAEKWKSTLSISEQLDLISDLNKELTRIRTDLAIQPPMMWCPNCKERHRSRFRDVSITAMYYALKKFEISKDLDINSMKRNWKKYSKLNGIDIYGKRIQSEIRDLDKQKKKSTTA